MEIPFLLPPEHSLQPTASPLCRRAVQKFDRQQITTQSYAHGYNNKLDQLSRTTPNTKQLSQRLPAHQEHGQPPQINCANIDCADFKMKQSPHFHIGPGIITCVVNCAAFLLTMARRLKTLQLHPHPAADGALVLLAVSASLAAPGALRLRTQFFESARSACPNLATFSIHL